jgi:PAS domain S-box-containing protein
MTPQFWKNRALIVRKLEIAFFSVGIALGLTLLMRQWLELPYWLLFLIAGIASAWIGGRAAGWTAVVLSTLTCDYFFVRPYYSLSIAPDDLPFFIGFSLAMLAGNWFGAWRKRTELAMQKTQAELASRVQEGGVKLERVSQALRSEVTHREQAEHDRRVAELRWRAVFDNAVVGMALADEGGRIIVSNRRFTYLVEIPDADGDGRGLAACLPESYRSAFGAQFGELLAARRQRIEMELPLHAGAGAWLRMHVALVAGTPEFPRFVIAFCEDVSERKRTEEALLSARANLAHAARLTTIGELTASIAHELNQPLAAIVTNGNACLRWLASASPNLKEAGNTLNWIMRDAKRASDVIARIRALMRKGEANWEPVGFNDIVRQVLELMEGELGRHQVAVSLELDPELPPIRGERIQLQQAFLNLVLNAVEAMAAITARPRQLLIRTARQEGASAGIAVDVCDSGPGVDEEDLDKLFTAFFTTKAEGTGLGLWISQSIVESHSGKLQAMRNRTYGMCFRLMLLCEPASAPVPAASSIAGEDFAVRDMS